MLQTLTSFISRLSIIVRVNKVLNGTVVDSESLTTTVDSGLRSCSTCFWNDSWAQTFSVGYLNEVLLRPRFRKSLDLQTSSLVRYFKKRNDFQVYAICFHETVYDKECLDKSVEQTENGLERSFVKHLLNSV